MNGQNNNINLRELNYRSVIPFYILWDLDLNANHLRFYCQIEQMESNPNPNVKPEFSYQWIADALKIDRRNAIDIAKKLKKKGYIARTKINQKDYLWNTVKNGVSVSSDENSKDLLVMPSITTKDLLVMPSITQNKDKELLLRNNPFFNDPNLEPVQNLNTSSGVKKKNFYTPFFESFWEMTNKRGKKLQAFNAWKRNGCETRNMLELYQTHYLVKFGDCETKYQKHISSWIESKPWEEPTPLTEEEVIAKALEQKQMTKDNAPKKTSSNLGKPKNENKDTTSVFAHIVLALGLFVPENVIEAFLYALKSKNMPCSEYALQIYAKEMEKIKMGKLDVVECINKFIASGWKSFDVKYFVKKEVDKSSPATGNKEHSNDTSWIYQINLQTEQ